MLWIKIRKTNKNSYLSSLSDDEYIAMIAAGGYAEPSYKHLCSMMDYLAGRNISMAFDIPNQGSVVQTAWVTNLDSLKKK